MTNAEFFTRAYELEAAHKAFRKAARGRVAESEWVRRAADDPYFYATKPADTALQVGLNAGSLVKVMANIDGAGMRAQYAVVAETPVLDPKSEYAKCDHVLLRLADGSTHSYRVDGRIRPPSSDESKMNPGDIKACDIPADLLSLILENCPLRRKGACMKGDAEPVDGQ